MASPLTLRQPLHERSINTPPFHASNTPAATTNSLLQLKSAVGQKRPHSLVTGQENGIQQQILTAATFKLPPPSETRPAQPRNVDDARVRSVQNPSQFKQPPPKAATVAEHHPPQRQQAHDPEADGPEIQRWRKYIKGYFRSSTFYLDGIDDSFKQQASRWIKVEQFFSSSVNVIITFRDPPPQTSSPTQPSTPVRTSLDKHVSARADFSVTSNFQTAESGPQPFEAEPQPTKDILVRARELKTLGSRAQPESAPHPSECEPQKKDILIRARELGIKIWTREKFKRILKYLPTTAAAPVSPNQPQAINPLHLSAALQAEKRHRRTTETDPSVPREEYVYFQGPYILVTDIAEVHKPIVVREYPVGSDRQDALWPMFWATREGSCPFLKPHPVTEPKRRTPAAEVNPGQRHYARPNVQKSPVLKENGGIVNRVPVEQPASGIVNSSNAFSAVRSTTTCGSKSNVTSALSGMGGAISVSAANSRQVRDLRTRLTPAIDAKVLKEVSNIGRMDPPPAKKRKTEVTLREQLVKAKKEKREAYCENCKEKYEDYEQHIQSRRHRKYARNNKNFVELDKLLKKLRRPLLDEITDELALRR